jgi:hypothetical protein
MVPAPSRRTHDSQERVRHPSTVSITAVLRAAASTEAAASTGAAADGDRASRAQRWT